MAIVRTVLGDISPTELGPTLIHEHLVIDVRRRHQGYADDVAAIVGPMLPHLALVGRQGIRTIVECTPTHMGRHDEAYREVARRSSLHIVMAHGTFRDDWLPDDIRAMPEPALVAWFLDGLDRGAGLLKLGCGRDGPSAAETRCARAAGTASARTGCLVACHLGWAAPAWRAIEAFAEGGGDPGRFVVAHLQGEADLAEHEALARRGAWLEYDAIGSAPSDAAYLDLLRRHAEAGLLGHVLVSQDACAYILGDSGVPDRHHRFDHLADRFLPRLRSAGFTAEDVETLLVHNPARALAMNG